MRRLHRQLEEQRSLHARQIDAMAKDAEEDLESLERELNAKIAKLEQQLEQQQAEHGQEVERSEQRVRDAETLRSTQRERADNAEAQIQQLRAEIEIFKARDELWAQWETRERARLEAETARLAAAKVRALELPHYEET